ncbi:MAG: cell division protein FtsB [Gallionellales bacterium RIFOXYD2_FULL_52_7]|nr:MAG: cell division protein FtsB [Gallionellales bacterium RIFOXYD2_FULL_52_7]
MRIITLILIVLLLLLQYPLWLGRGGWLRVWDLHHQVEAQQQINGQTQERNALLDAEVRDLKQGTEAIEERARSELGMIKSDEVFFQILDESANQLTEKLAASSPVSAAPGVVRGSQP